MRAYNLTHEQMQTAVSAAFPGAKWRYTGDGLQPGYTNRLDGWVFLPTSSPYRVAKAGTLTRYPCIHGYKALVGKLLGLDLQSYWYVQPYGKLAVSSESGSKWYRIGLAMSGKGYACGPTCPVAHPVGQPTSASAAAQAPAEPPAQSRTMPLTDGPLLTDGESTDRTALRYCRSLSAVCQTTYVLEEMYVAASMIQVPTCAADVRNMRDHFDVVAWARRLMTYRKGFAARFARNLFDFMLLASWGEARESSSGYGSRYHFSGDNPLQYDPRSLSPGLGRCFESKLGYHGHSYGGFNWARIARFASKYYAYAVPREGRPALPIVFADHVVDLAHNGGLMTNKGFSFDRPDTATFTAMLDRKRNGYLTQGDAPLTLTEECARLLSEAQALGLMPRTRATVTIKADPTVPTMKWGTKVFHFTLKPGSPTDAQVAERYAAEEAATKAAAHAVAHPPVLLHVAQAPSAQAETEPATVLAPAR